MIIVLFGQPCSGKTTLAKKLSKDLSYGMVNSPVINIDGDDLRGLFKNVDFSREGRLANLKRASELAYFLHMKGFIVLVSVMYPFLEARDYLNSLHEHVNWVYLEYDIHSEKRGREEFRVQDFEEPTADELMNKNFLVIDTTKYGESKAMLMIKKATKL